MQLDPLVHQLVCDGRGERPVHVLARVPREVPREDELSERDPVVQKRPRVPEEYLDAAVHPPPRLVYRVRPCQRLKDLHLAPGEERRRVVAPRLYPTDLELPVPVCPEVPVEDGHLVAGLRWRERDPLVDALERDVEPRLLLYLISQPLVVVLGRSCPLQPEGVDYPVNHPEPSPLGDPRSVHEHLPVPGAHGHVRVDPPELCVVEPEVSEG